MLDSPSSRRGNASLDAVLADARQRFTAANPRSLERHQQAASSLPGGNTRAVLWYRPFPLTLVSGDGCHVTDLDGHRYVDLVSEYSAGLYGHSDKTIAAALKEVIDQGLLLGAPNRFEARYAAAIVERFPAVERVRFCNSGTEANIMALSAARAISGKSKIMAFREGYHGGVLTFAHGGSPLNLPFPFVFADYNDTEGTVRLIEELGDDLAAVIIEPMMGGGGCIPAERAFLAALREATAKAGAFLIFDEVMTSRLSPGGRQALLDIIPDMTTLGKYIGGGMSFGAFGGRRDLMRYYDPRDGKALIHAGTFNNNVLTMAAGYAAMSRLLTPERSVALNARGDALRERLAETFARARAPYYVTGLGSVMTIHAAGDPARASMLKDLMFFDLVRHGYYIARRGMIALSLPVTDEDVDGCVAAVEAIVNARGDVYSAMQMAS